MLTENHFKNLSTNEESAIYFHAYACSHMTTTEPIWKEIPVATIHTKFASKGIVCNQIASHKAGKDLSQLCLQLTNIFQHL